MSDDDFDDHSSEYGTDLVPAASNDDVTPDDSHATIRQNRSVTIHFEGYVSVSVIEPPQVFNAEIEQAVQRRLMGGLAGLTLGSPSNINVNVSASEPEPSG